MAWTYVQKSGSLYGPDGKKVGIGYSGHGSGLDNPDAQTVHAVGPCPVGMYTIGPARHPIDHLGPLAMPLEPNPANEMFGRSAFFIHGDNASLDHSASDGCLIFAHGFRQMIDDSSDNQMRVVAEESDVAAFYKQEPTA